MKQVCVTGAAGFVAGHLCHYLRDLGYWVRGVDYVEPRYGAVDCDEGWWDCDLRSSAQVDRAMRDIDEVYALAADMGGAGYAFSGENDYNIMANNAAINICTMDAAIIRNVSRYLFTSSACIYNQEKQASPDSPPLKEEDAYPAFPDSAYGWEKIFTEQLCKSAAYNTTMEIRIARFHNIFGPQGSYNDGREKLPAAACRKVAEAKLTDNHEIEVWGDGEQTRSFCYIDDCLEMLYLLMHSDFRAPMNIGTDRMVSVNEVFDIVADIAGIEIEKVHDLTKPQGVRGRNADLSLMRKVLDYEPQVSLEDGLRRTYGWIENQVIRGFKE